MVGWFPHTSCFYRWWDFRAAGFVAIIKLFCYWSPSHRNKGADACAPWNFSKNLPKSKIIFTRLWQIVLKMEREFCPKQFTGVFGEMSIVVVTSVDMCPVGIPKHCRRSYVTRLRETLWTRYVPWICCASLSIQHPHMWR